MKKLAFLPLITLIFFSSCSDEDEVTTIIQQDQEAVADEVSIEGTFEEIDDLAYSASMLSDGGKLEEDGRYRCAEISRVDNTITVNFGEGCEGPGGVTRAGKIIISRTGRYFEMGAQHSVTFEDFTVNNISVEGTRTVTNLGVNENENFIFDVTLSNGKVTLPDGREVTRDANFTRTWIRGGNPTLDELHVEGSASGINKRGLSYTMNIIEPLVYKASCRIEGFPIAVDGVKQVTTEQNNFNIDFGSGECDDTVIITVNGASATVDLNI